MQAHAARLTPASAPPLARPVQRRARVFAIASGKGGVGKTNIAVNLAIRLARMGQRVVLVDADLGTANVDVVLNVRSSHDLSHVLRGERTVDEVTVQVEDRLRLIVGASGLASVADLSAFDRQRIIEELGGLETQCDILLLDCGAGISSNVLAFAQAADELLVVTTPEPTALTDAYALIKVLSRAAHTPPVRLIVNQARSDAESRHVAERVGSVAERFLGLHLASAGALPDDAHVESAVRERVPFVIRYPRCPASTALTALATQLIYSGTNPSYRVGFFRRAIRFFY
jgi:flagellar biosynthesis protein FlhG